MSKTAQISLEIGYTFWVTGKWRTGRALMFSHAVTQRRITDSNQDSICMVFLRPIHRLRGIGRSVE
jgi:hypothetical protein